MTVLIPTVLLLSKRLCFEIFVCFGYYFDVSECGAYNNTVFGCLIIWNPMFRKVDCITLNAHSIYYLIHFVHTFIVKQ